VKLKTDFIINPDLLVENFDNGSLVLNIKTREVIEISSDEYWLLEQIKKKNIKDEVKKNYINEMKSSQKKIDNHIERMYNRLLKEKLIFDRGEFMKNKYKQNPAVNLREEDEDGALLFNPDSNRIQLLNNTGFFIWKLCSEGKTSLELSEAVRQEYSDVPDEQVNEDVKQFLDEMAEIGFIEIAKKKKSKGA
jgi:hypothetical protein